MEKWTDEQIRELLDRLPESPWEWIEDRWHGGWRGIVDAAGEEVIWPVLDPDDNDIDRFPWFHEDELDDNVREFITASRELVPSLLARARKAESEVRKLTKDMQELLAERRDLKTMLADAGIRNAVLEKRLNYTTELLAQLGNCPSVEPVQGCINVPCGVCWHEWLEQEGRA